MFIICLVCGILTASMLSLLVYNLSNLMMWLADTFGEKSVAVLMIIILGIFMGMLFYASCIL